MIPPRLPAVVGMPGPVLEEHRSAQPDEGQRHEGREVALEGGSEQPEELHTEDLRQEGIIPAWVDGPAMASLVLALANGIVLHTEVRLTTSRRGADMTRRRAAAYPWAIQDRDGR